jgi:glycosyltransferase involved in cell wall biosynthesis
MLSIITPVLNGAETIAQTISSIKGLAIPYEHIIVDGGSTDATINIVKSFEDVTLIVDTTNRGMYASIDTGFDRAQGSLLTWVNCDDVIIVDGYHKMYEEYVKNDDDKILIVSHGYHNFTEEYRYRKVKALPFVRYWLKSGIFPFVQPSACFTRSAYEAVSGFDFNRLRLIADRVLFQSMACSRDISIIRLDCYSSVFARYGGSLLYRNRQLHEREKNMYPTTYSFFHRILHIVLRSWF